MSLTHRSGAAVGEVCAACDACRDERRPFAMSVNREKQEKRAKAQQVAEVKKHEKKIDGARARSEESNTIKCNFQAQGKCNGFNKLG